MSWYGGFPRYVTVAERKRKAANVVEKLKKKGQICHPIVIAGRSIATTFWGKAWCKNLESYSDYANRLPRGRSYVRHGAVIDLNVANGEITAKVSGASLYNVKITIDKVAKSKWQHIVRECAGKIDSVIELLQGKFSKAVMQKMSDPQQGLFPYPKEIKLSCSCPDWAAMCKHVAAVLYGVGARLDEKPEGIFLLRHVDPAELITGASATSFISTGSAHRDPVLESSDLSSLFGIDLGDASKTTSPSTQKKTQTPKKKKIAPQSPNSVNSKKTGKKTMKQAKAKRKVKVSRKGKKKKKLDKIKKGARKK